MKRNVLKIVVSAEKVNVRYIIFVTRIRKIVLIPPQVIIIIFSVMTTFNVILCVLYISKCVKKLYSLFHTQYVPLFKYLSTHYFWFTKVTYYSDRLNPKLQKAYILNCDVVIRDNSSNYRSTFLACKM